MIRDTTKESRDNPLLALLQTAGPGGIEAQEQCGQDELVQSKEIPKRCRITDEDNIFRPVEFPEGWSIKATDHSMWSDLIDDKGRKRAGIFYKAAFYDRSAHISFNRRLFFRKDHDHPETKGIKYIVFDQDKELASFTDESVPDFKVDPNGWRAVHGQSEVALEKKCTEWLCENGYRNFENCLSHWDEN